MTFVDVNYITVLVTGIVGFIIGALWYSPVLFGKQWMEFSGISSKKMKEMKKNGMAMQMIIGFIATLLTSFILANFIVFAGATTALTGLKLAFWIWLGFVFPVQLGMVLWEGKSPNLLVINASHQLVMLIVMGTMLGLWA
jgi:hypothetical protein